MKAKEKAKVAFCCPHHGVLQNSVEYTSAKIGSKRMASIPIMQCHECNEYYTPFTNLLAFSKLEYKGKQVKASNGRVEKGIPRTEVIKPYYEDVQSEPSIEEMAIITNREERHSLPDLSKLTKTDIEYLCRQMSPKDIRSYFQRYSKDFTHIKPGFRPTALSDDDVINLMIRYSDKPFIWSYIKNIVKIWFSEIDDFRKKKEENGFTTEESLLLAIPQSVFAENVELFITLSGANYTPDYVLLLKTATSMLKKPILEAALVEPSIDSDTEEEMEGLKKAVAQLQNDLDEEKTAHSNDALALAEITALNEVLQQSLSDAEARADAAASKTVQMQEELELLRKLAKYTDSDSVDVSDPEYEYTSICQVHSDYYSGKTWLTRLADIHDGKISRFTRIEDIPYYFGNRDRLFWRDGPNDDGHIGIWHWNAVPNRSDPSTDYVTTSFSKFGKIIEVVELPNCRTFEDIVNYIADNGIPYVQGKKHFFTLSGSKGNIPGLLCNDNDLEIVNGTAKLKPSTCVLPQYIISSADIITIAGKNYYRLTNMGTPQDIYHLKSPFAVVKDVVVSRATSTALRQQGITKKEAQHCQLFLMDLPVTTVSQEIATAYGCTEKEAAEYLAQFLTLAESYLNESDLDLGTLSAALPRNPDMVAKCKQLLESEWRTENEAMLEAAKAKYEQVVHETKVLDNRINQLSGSVAELIAQGLEIESQISDKLQLAADVEKKVSDRIAAAQENVADFICEMAFVCGRESQAPKVESEAKKDVAIRRTVQYNHGGIIDDLDMLEEELACNFEALGYNTTSANQMAQIAVFCICNKQPILCGSNAEAIADAISVLLHSMGAYEITLPMATDRCSELCEALDAQCVEENAVVLINGAFDGYSINAYTTVMQYTSQWRNHRVLLFSISGIEPASIPSAVWDNAWFIDGDIGLSKFPHGLLNSFDIACELVPQLEEASLKDARKKLKHFDCILSNRATLNYAGYMSVSGNELEKTALLILQLLIQAKAKNQNSEMFSLLESAGIDIAKQKLLDRYL